MFALLRHDEVVGIYTCKVYAYQSIPLFDSDSYMIQGPFDLDVKNKNYGELFMDLHQQFTELPKEKYTHPNKWRNILRDIISEDSEKETVHKILDIPIF
jgi:hypothetical protein